MFRTQREATLLAGLADIGWNVDSSTTKLFQMHVKRRRQLLPNFETCSVALFAGLALYGPLPARSQSAAPAALSSQSVPASTLKTTALPGRVEEPGTQRDGSISSAGFDESLK
jgi:hypothetical protein